MHIYSASQRIKCFNILQRALLLNAHSVKITRQRMCITAHQKATTAQELSAESQKKGAKELKCLAACSHFSGTVLAKSGTYQQRKNTGMNGNALCLTLQHILAGERDILCTGPQTRKNRINQV